MDASLFLAAAFAVTLATGLALGAVLHRPTLLILTELCGDDTRARFWLVFAKVVMVLFPVLSVASFLPPPGRDLAVFVQAVTALADGGLLVPVLAIGWAVWSTRPKPAAGVPDPAEPDPEPPLAPAAEAAP